MKSDVDYNIFINFLFLQELEDNYTPTPLPDGLSTRDTRRESKSTMDGTGARRSRRESRGSVNAKASLEVKA